MYLTHHYFIDLIGGSILAVSVFYIAQRRYLPQVQGGKLFRWHYESVIKGHYNVAKLRESRSRASSAAAVTAWQMNGSFVDLERGVQGVPPNSEDEEVNWEMQDLSPAEEEIEREEGASGSFSPSEGSTAGIDSIWTLESDGDTTNATTIRQDTEDDHRPLSIKASSSRKR